MPSAPRTQFKMLLSKDELMWLQELAEFQGLTVADYVRRLIGQHRFALQQAAAEELKRRAAIRKRKK